jgi:hypothetical protein
MQQALATEPLKLNGPGFYFEKNGNFKISTMDWKIINKFDLTIYQNQFTILKINAEQLDILRQSIEEKINKTFCKDLSIEGAFNNLKENNWIFEQSLSEELPEQDMLKYQQINEFLSDNSHIEKLAEEQTSKIKNSLSIFGKIRMNMLLRESKRYNLTSFLQSDEKF